MRTPALLIALALVGVACAGAADPDGAGADAPGADDAASPVGDWVLAVADPPIAIPDGARATLAVEEDGRAGGSTPCNGFGGTARWGEGGDWSFGDMAVTEMGCEQPRMAAQEEYLDALTSASAWATPTADTLLLTTADGTLTFDRSEPVDAAGLVGTDWVLGGFVRGDTVERRAWDVDDARLRLDGDDEGGTFMLFSGCRDFDGQWVVADGAVRLPSWGQSDGSRDVDDCTEEELESEALVLAALEGGFTAQLDGGSLTVRSAADAGTGLQLRPAGEDG